MPSLRVLISGKPPRIYQLYKKITTLGRGEDNDIALPSDSLGENHGHIHYDGRDFVITSLQRSNEIYINGKKRRKHTLTHKDSVVIGDVEMVFNLFDEPLGDDKAPSSEKSLAYQRILEFSTKLMNRYDLPSLLEEMMDMVIQLTKADKGFLILLEGNELRVKVARNVRKENIENAVSKLSDSIIAKVIRERRPVIVSDALHDEEFNASESVVNLKLCSVMSVPLMEKGNAIGLIYVGNDNVVNLFEESALDTLTIFAAQASLIIQNALLVNELQLDNLNLHARLEVEQFGEIIGSCESMQEVFRRIRRVAATDVSVLLEGETGTGKEMAALEVHRLSLRVKGPFVSINCGAIPENLLESELFGHMKGAFTGAVVNREGKFQASDGGTLFLDEIGEMPLNLQVKILRAIQEKTVTRVGSTRAEAVDVRFLAASNRNLEEEIQRGTFREDLYYRLNVVSIRLPPLRERGDDIVALARYFLRKYAEKYERKVKGFSPNAVIAMLNYPWPGNVRQLENRLKKAVIMADGALLTPEDLDLRPEDLEPILPLAVAKEEFQRRYVNEVLARNNGNRTKTARDLKVDPRTIFRHLEKEAQAIPDK